jgi:hypothetical protein
MLRVVPVAVEFGPAGAAIVDSTKITCCILQLLASVAADAICWSMLH